MKQFSEFLATSIVWKTSPNVSRCLSLIEESQKKERSLQRIKSLGIDEETASTIIDTVYDCYMQRIRAKMLAMGFKTMSHEAEISYCMTLGLPEVDVRELDELRRIRNGNKYYGESVQIEYAKKLLSDFNKLQKELMRVCK